MEAADQLTHATPGDLYADTDQNEGRESKHDVDAGVAEPTDKGRRETVGYVNRETQRKQAKQGGSTDDDGVRRKRFAGAMRADGQCDGNRAGSDCQRQRERIKCVARAA